MKVGKVTESIFDGVTAVIPLAEVCYVVKFTNCIDIHFKSGHELNLIPPDQNAFLAAWCRYRAELEADTLMDFEEAQPAPSIPEGWKLVPIEPTDEMVRIATAEYVQACSRRLHPNIAWRQAFKSMLAAAPNERSESPDAKHTVDDSDDLISTYYKNRNRGSLYNEKKIAWELERTAIGDGYYGNALRVAKDFPCLNDEDRSVLDRFATGQQQGTDHVKLQDIAMRLYFSDTTKAKP